LPADPARKVIEAVRRTLNIGASSDGCCSIVGSLLIGGIIALGFAKPVVMSKEI